ncbi:MAG: helix-turn-helix domain-containing protein [Oscillospiraceae bacterium]|nr:helix-turn-helix domain-containing protein [Oscillospiraceae bacterium]
MATKVYKKSAQWYDSPLNSRLRELLKEKGIKSEEFAARLGISTEAVRLWCGGYSRPDLDKIPMIAEFLEVSTDYLLGRSFVKSADIQIKGICAYTGLTESAVIKLNEMNSANVTSKAFKANTTLEILSDIICHENFTAFLSETKECFRLAGQAKIYEYKKELEADEEANDYHIEATTAESVYDSEAENYASYVGKRTISIENLSKMHKVWAIESLDEIIRHLGECYSEEYLHMNYKESEVKAK